MYIYSTLYLWQLCHDSSQILLEELRFLHVPLLIELVKVLKCAHGYLIKEGMLGDLQCIWSNAGLHCQGATDKRPELSGNLTKSRLRYTTDLGDK